MPKVQNHIYKDNVRLYNKVSSYDYPFKVIEIIKGKLTMDYLEELKCHAVFSICKISSTNANW